MSAADGDPVGYLDFVQQTADGRIEVTGWAADPLAPGAPVELHSYVTGPYGTQGTPGKYTGLPRPDVAAIYGWTGGGTGFRFTVPNSGFGSTNVCVFAISSGGRTNPVLGCVQLNVWIDPPVGFIDSMTVSGSTAVISGWAFDPNRRDVSIALHVYVNGQLNQGFLADQDRPDVNNAFGIGGRHGFSGSVQLTAPRNSVCVYGIGQFGNNGLIGGCRSLRSGGSPKPDASSTGAPTGFAALPRYSGPLTITADGTVIDGQAVYGDLRIQARNVIIRNSYLHCGSDVPSGNSGCVDANSPNVYNLLVENNTIVPDRPSWYRDGIVGHEFTAVGNNIAGTNDGIGIFNRPGGSPAANVRVENNYIHDLTRWNSDPAHADGTHNDGIEVQGGQNIYIAGNNVVGSVVPGDGLGPYGLHGGAALIVVQNTAPVQNLVVEGNWFDDAQNSVCINHGKFGSVSLTLQNNIFGRNQFDFGNGSKYQIRIYSRSASSVEGLFSNFWEDSNVALAEGRNSGIRYNGP